MFKSYLWVKEGFALRIIWILWKLWKSSHNSLQSDRCIRLWFWDAHNQFKTYLSFQLFLYNHSNPNLNNENNNVIFTVLKWPPMNTSSVIKVAYYFCVIAWSIFKCSIIYVTIATTQYYLTEKIQTTVFDKTFYILVVLYGRWFY